MSKNVLVFVARNLYVLKLNAFLPSSRFGPGVCFYLSPTRFEPAIKVEKSFFICSGCGTCANLYKHKIALLVPSYYDDDC